MATDQPSAPATPPNSTPSPQKPRRKGRVLLILLLGLAAALIIGGGAAFVVYDQATAIDRSTPAVVIDQFLDSAIVLKDPNRVSLFVCDSWSASAAMSATNAPSDPNVHASWGDITSTQTADRATATATVRFSVANGGGSSRSVQRWQFSLKDEDGWRVCGLTKA